MAKYKELLVNYNYDKNETDYLTSGLQNGFEIEYEGPREGVRTSNNLKLRVGNTPVEQTNKGSST